jgi:hypothetical protein
LLEVDHAHYGDGILLVKLYTELEGDLLQRRTNNFLADKLLDSKFIFGELLRFREGVENDEISEIAKDNYIIDIFALAIRYNPLFMKKSFAFRKDHAKAAIAMMKRIARLGNEFGANVLEPLLPLLKELVITTLSDVLFIIDAMVTPGWVKHSILGKLGRVVLTPPLSNVRINYRKIETSPANEVDALELKTPIHYL